ncbi:MAG: CsgG/HfaB family protein [Treponema sp.]|jgi:TolB-like protein|nr:CsgG/HfaB family protein [Treponema sp.]
MKKLVFGCLFIFLATFTYGSPEMESESYDPVAAIAQLPGVVVFDFTVRARDISADEAIIVTDMFMTELAAKKQVNVIDRTVLEKAMSSLKFGSTDWSNREKTTQLGETLGAEYLMNGTITQLGTSITLSITVRDIKTLAVISSEQKQYTAENIWNNDLSGVPGQLPSIINSLSVGINAEHDKRQQAKKAQLAREDAERKKREEEERQASYSLVGSWRKTYSHEWSSNFDYRNYTSESQDELQFYSDGAFSGTSHSVYLKDGNTNRGYAAEGRTVTDTVYRGTYIREGDSLKLSWTEDRKRTWWEETVETGLFTSNRYEVEKSSNSSRSGSGTYTLNFGNEAKYITLQNGNTFGGDFYKQ